MASLTTFDVGECNCPVCTVTICAHGCNNSPLPGADVQVKSGATVIDSGATDGTGCVTFNIPGGGTYTVIVSKTGFVTDTNNRILACGSTYTINLTVASTYHCLSCCPDPQPETLHVSNTGFIPSSGTFTWSGVSLWWQATVTGRTLRLHTDCTLDIIVGAVFCRNVSLDASSTCDPLNLVFVYTPGFADGVDCHDTGTGTYTVVL